MILTVRGVIKQIREEEEGMLLRMMIFSHRYLFDDAKWIVCSPHAYKNFMGEATESPHYIGGSFEGTCIIHAFNSSGTPILGLYHTYKSE